VDDVGAFIDERRNPRNERGATVVELGLPSAAPMKRLGIIGGIGPESTVVYYRSILAAGRERLGGAPPPVLITSIDVQMVLRLAEEDPSRDYGITCCRNSASSRVAAPRSP
jgi:hypothetical protein